MAISARFYHGPLPPAQGRAVEFTSLRKKGGTLTFLERVTVHYTIRDGPLRTSSSPTISPASTSPSSVSHAPPNPCINTPPSSRTRNDSRLRLPPYAKPKACRRPSAARQPARSPGPASRTRPPSTRSTNAPMTRAPALSVICAKNRGASSGPDSAASAACTRLSAATACAWPGG